MRLCARCKAAVIDDSHLLCSECREALMSEMGIKLPESKSTRQKALEAKKEWVIGHCPDCGKETPRWSHLPDTCCLLCARKRLEAHNQKPPQQVSKHVDYASELDGVKLSISLEEKAHCAMLWIHDKAGRLMSGGTMRVGFDQLFGSGARSFKVGGRWVAIRKNGGTDVESDGGAYA